MLDITIPEAWLAVLRSVQKTCPSACIAGGALRDLAFGGTPKDLDIFVPVVESQSGPVLQGSRWSLTGSYCATRRAEVHAVEEVVLEDGFPVQVVHLSLSSFGFALSVVNRMDFDACRVVHTGRLLWPSPSFAHALQTRSMTHIRCEDATQARRSLRRAERFQERYPDVTINTDLAQEVLQREAA